MRSSSGPWSIVVLGLSLRSSWGNGHATTYRGLLAALAARGHRILFLERDVPWYRDHTDLADPPYARLALYGSLEELRDRFGDEVRRADVVVVGSYVPEGVAVGRWVQAEARGVVAFYDIDTPVTLAKLAAGDTEYLAPELMPGFDVYFSFTGGPTLQRLERRWGVPRARALYCAVEVERYTPQPQAPRWDLGYLGTYAADRQPALEALLLEPARRWPDGRFVVAGPQYPPTIAWPANVERCEHLAPPEHPGFYGAQRFTLNVTRAPMRRLGWSPSVRLFEAAACATPILTDPWPGLAAFFRPGEEIFVVRGPAEVLELLRRCPEERRRAVGERARARVLAAHTPAHRAAAFEAAVAEAWGTRRGRAAGG